MVVVDIVIGVLLLLSIWSGWKKGIVYQIVSLISVFIGIYVASQFWYFLFGIIQSYLDWDKTLLKYISMILTATLVISGVFLIGKLLSKLIEITIFGVFDKVLGALLSLVEIMVVFSFLIFGVNYFFPNNNLFTKEKIEESYVLPYIEPIAVKIVDIFEDLTLDDEMIKKEVDKNIFVGL